MGESLTQQRRVEDEGFRVVNSCWEGRIAQVRIGSAFDGTSKESSG